MFACTQTIVCLHANDCLAAGKHGKMISVAPQGMLYGSWIDAPWFLKEYLTARPFDLKRTIYDYPQSYHQDAKSVSSQ